MRSSGSVARRANAGTTRGEHSELLTLQVVRRERLSPHFARVVLGRGDVHRFRPMGFDQWFRLFIPVRGGTLEHVPPVLDRDTYQRFVQVPAEIRPVLRNYTVREYRPDAVDGPEIVVDFVVHGHPGDGTAGPASTWAQTCHVGDEVAILDEGVLFRPPPGTARVELVADESALPALAGVLAALPAAVTGHALVEVPSEADRQTLDAPPGVELTWVVRDEHAVPGGAALESVADRPLPAEPFHGWVAGEQALAAGVRRHWTGAGVAKERITFCGYWRADVGRRRGAV
jgi:NADPH-dependent ferric siderophore reductase